MPQIERVAMCCSVLQCVLQSVAVSIHTYKRCVLQCVALCYSLLQCASVYCFVLQRVVVCCSILQSNAVCCSVLQCVAVCCSVLQCTAVCCSVLQCVAVCCSVLQCVAVCCRMLQRVAACYSVLHVSHHLKIPGINVAVQKTKRPLSRFFALHPFSVEFFACVFVVKQKKSDNSNMCHVSCVTYPKIISHV